MIEIHMVSPENEMPAARRSRTLATEAWPDIAESARDRIDILVGVRTPVDVDLVVVIRLDRPRAIPPQQRRLGGTSAESAIQHAVERLSRDLAARAAVDALRIKAGSTQIRMIGRGGSGKTTSLALLAIGLAELGQRVLISTLHRTPRSDIAHLAVSLGRRAAIPGDRITVETTMGFVLSALEGLGGTVPLKGTSPRWAAPDGVLDETRHMLVDDTASAPGDVARLRAANPERFAWDHVFVDSEIVANRWMLIPPTRAVHTLVITVRDPQSPVVARLRAAVDDPAMPGDAVEWVDANALGRTLAAPAAVR